jgi:uncharacterized protein (TIGR00369 family)
VADEVGGESDVERLARLRDVLESVPFAKLLGIELAAAEKGAVTLQLQIRAELRQNQGVLHGGVIASLIDTATAFAIVSQLTEPEKFTTVDLTVSYLRPLTQGIVTAQARVVRAGRRLLNITAEVYDGAGKLAAVALSTYIKLA